MAAAANTTDSARADEPATKRRYQFDCGAEDDSQQSPCQDKLQMREAGVYGYRKHTPLERREILSDANNLITSDASEIELTTHESRQECVAALMMFVRETIPEGSKGRADLLTNLRMFYNLDPVRSINALVDQAGRDTFFKYLTKK